jgi:tetratricopeptide (TPR) repeat protein
VIRASLMSRMRGVGLGLCMGLCLGLGACAADEGESPRESRLDTRLEVHAPLASPPSAAGLAYVQAVAAAHREADPLDDAQARIRVLLTAVERPVPVDDGTAELVQLELLARTAELLLEQGQPERALALLEPRLATSTSLAIDRAAARCLVALGDAAVKTGDHGLAMGSYARALEMLSLLLEGVEP